MSDPADIIADVGTAVVLLLICAQLPAMYTVVFKTRSVENLSVFPTVGQASNFITWSVYGLLKGDPNIYRVNVIGSGFAVMYSAIFLLYASPAGRNTMLLTIFGTAALLAAVFAGVIIPTGLSMDVKESILGGVAVGCNTVMYASPLSQLYLALRVMDPAIIPFALTLAGTAASMLWFSYGYLVGNWFVAGPNAAGIFLALVQIAVIGYIYMRIRADPSLRKGAKQEEGEEQAQALLDGPEPALVDSSINYAGGRSTAAVSQRKGTKSDAHVDV